MPNFTFQGKEFPYRTLGEGKPVILLHGFLSSAAGWFGLAEQLAENFQVFTLNFPGHGGTVTLEENSLEAAALYLKAFLDKIGLEKVNLVGHSLGGYWALAFAEAFPTKVSKMVLLHSHPWADNTSGKQRRDQMIKLVEKGFREKVVSLVVPRLVRPESQEALQTQLTEATWIGQATSDEGVIAALHAMRERPDRSGVLQQTHFKVLWVSGKYDSFYPPTKAESFPLPMPHQHVFLEQSAHAGFLEEPEQCGALILRFLREE